MGQGQGSTTVNQRTLPSNGPPFSLNSAINGLSVNAAGRIVLGQDVGAVGDPAQLLSNREIPLKGFAINMRGNVISESINDTTGIYQITEALGNPGLYVDWINRDFGFGDFFAAHNGINLELNDFIQRVLLGDSNSINNGTFLFLDDAVQLAEISTGGGQMLELDPLNDVFWIGDIPGLFNNTFLYMDTRSFEIDCSGKRAISGDNVTGQYRFGDSGHFKNGMEIVVDDSGAAGNFIIRNTALNSKVIMNGVNGFTGTVTPVISITVNGGIVTNVT
jgi:hypothetical protein